MNTILFLHGWGAGSLSWLPVRKFFEHNYNCIFAEFDCNPNIVFTLDDYVSYVERLLISHKVTHCYVVAHSFGARVAVLLANRNPHMIRKMVLTGAAGLKPRFSFKTYFRIKLYKTFGVGKGSSDYRSLSSAGKQTFKNIIYRDLSSEIRKLKNPTLLIFGKNDRATPVYMGKRWTRLQKRSRLKIYRDAGHYAFIDRPAKFISDAYKYIEE